MGHKLNRSSKSNPSMHMAEDVASFSSTVAIPWLDSETARYLHHVLQLLIERREDFQAAILYGSMARQEARPLDDPDPSDVDILLIFTAEQGSQRISAAQHTAVSWAKVEVIDRYPEARDLQFMLTVPDFAGWDESFIANVAQDGIALWTRDRLPEALHALEERQQQAYTL